MAEAQAEQAQLKAGAIGFVDALVIGLASTSPAYSLAAIIGAVTALAGVNAPGILLASFVPMALIATAFLYLNRVDPDCGTTFSWVTRAMGPWFGWIGGWAIMMTGVLDRRVAGRRRRPVRPLRLRRAVGSTGLARPATTPGSGCRWPSRWCC